MFTLPFWDPLGPPRYTYPKHCKGFNCSSSRAQLDSTKWCAEGCTITFTLMLVTITFATGVMIIRAAWKNRASFYPDKHKDPREPPLWGRYTPVGWHQLGIWWHGSSFLDTISKGARTPISTLPLPSNFLFPRRVYIITRAELAKRIFEHPNIVLEPLFSDVPARAVLLSERARQILDKPGEGSSRRKKAQNADREGFNHQNISKMVPTFLDRAAEAVNSLNRAKQEFPPHKSLLDWLLYNITIAAGVALFGKHDPFISRDTKQFLTDALSTFKTNFTYKVFALTPEWLVPYIVRAYRVRALSSSAYGTYHDRNYHLHAELSMLVRQRGKIYRKGCIDASDVGNLHLSLLQIATEGIVWTAFFMLVHIAADRQTTSIIQEDIEKALTKRISNGKTTITLRVQRLSTDSTLLTSTYFEALRLVSSRVRTRMVKKDTKVSDGKFSYLLKAGAAVHVPAASSNMSSEFWKPNASSFDPQRFLLRQMDKLPTTEKPLHEQIRAFFPFGDGDLPSPARDHAFTVTCAIVAALITGFDIKLKNGNDFQLPEYYRTKLADVVADPYSWDLGAMITIKEGWESVTWKFIP